ncbi:hypothetical protein GCM10010371_48080 [Streptomyces subrutilus]|uniref:Uncharacterized protein n=1 Tax=Streptomyces subrutilus TaxID=36818 RepID=A0A918R4E5_9ACTN|nr:hypothetical protein GCM10010371_48080 [Streptomyces subrutilus]
MRVSHRGLTLPGHRRTAGGAGLRDGRGLRRGPGLLYADPRGLPWRTGPGLAARVRAGAYGPGRTGRGVRARARRA